MKTKLLLTTLLSFYFCLLSSQIPQGFNYQAIARDGSGNPITGATMQVKIGILSDTIANIMVWEELFNPVKTSAFGMFNIVVGTGVKQSGSAASFSAIDWTKTPLFLRTSIYYPSTWKVIGTTKLQSVPYSMVAASLEGTVPLLSVKGSTTTMDSALFVVRNNTGQIVFAVYNEGVRIYVDDGVAKGATKGGFAIGSFNKTKGVTQPLFVVDPDSIRAYLDNNPTKAVKGGFAIGSFDRSKNPTQNFLMVSKDSIRMYIDDNLSSKSTTKGGFAIGSFDKSKGGNVNYLNVAPDSTGRVFPSQNRILWYPLKNALLVGKVIAENKDSVGINSFASGYESRSKGKYSQALGYQAISRGVFSTSIGYQSVAQDSNSFAFGQWAQAKNRESYAFGRGAIADGYRSFAFGSAGIDSLGKNTGVAYAHGNYSFTIGQGSISYGRGSVSLGLADTAKGDYCLAMGLYTSANNFCSTSSGYKTRSTGSVSFASGYMTSAGGFASSSLGQMTTALGIASLATGYGSSATGSCATSMGQSTMATGDYSLATGLFSKSVGSISLATGYYTMANGFAAFSGGKYTLATGDYSLAFGAFTKAGGLYSLTLGEGSIASGKDALATGLNTKAKSYTSLAIGQYNDSTCSATGSTSWISTDPLFIAGNGSADNARSDAFIILKNGNTAIGHSSPTQMLDVNGNARFRGVTSGTFGNNLNIMADGTLTTATSDISMKENIFQISDALERVSKMRGVFFYWKNDSTKTRQIGMIAQEVEPVVPEIVFTNHVDGLKGINYSQASALFVEAIKEQQKIIESQKDEISSLKSRMDQIESQQKEIGELKTLVNTLVANQTVQGNK